MTSTVCLSAKKKDVYKRQEYHILLTKNETYMEVNEKMRQRCDEIRKETEKPYTFQDLEDWKYQYRRSHI